MATPTTRMLPSAGSDHQPYAADLFRTDSSRQSTSTIGTAFTADTAVTTPSDAESPPRSSRKPVSKSSLHRLPNTDSRLTHSSARSSSVTASTASAASSPAAPAATPHTKNKKKSSFLGSIFTKEPSTDAFLQMQLQARNKQPQVAVQSNTAIAMCGVSSAKIPEHVPKVNSKWDGMPQNSKEKRDYGDSSAYFPGPSGRTSFARPGSMDRRSHQSSGRQTADSNADSNLASRRAAPGGSNQHDKRPGSSKPAQDFSRSLHRNSATRPRSRTASIQTQSLRSPSGTSLPQITCFFPNDIPEPAGLTQPCGAASSIALHHPASARHHGPSTAPTSETADGRIPQHSTAFPNNYPSIDRPLKATDPLPHQTVQRDNGCPPDSHPNPSNFDRTPHHLRTGRLEASSDAGKVFQDCAGAFLAGEASSIQMPDEKGSTGPNSMAKNQSARLFGPGLCVQQDLEKRPDSSRARLGLRASMIKDDAVPWGSSEDNRPSSNVANRLSRSKIVLPKRLSVFGKA